ncbi:MAG: AMP-binding protein [Snodgrassella sp.]|uniref:Long-chain-fatty-acid--CoA ligase n=1 Tax=Snodgrassella alvi TaxID=1196083 RepID=A0A2N9XX08_9NEIS|nr:MULTISPECIES: AMP-binding protein [Snodgrassella]MCO6513006.1 AMP-binding protein [Snodgrassella sp.]MCO6517633.1 AMP-binding protein [Snodgrassella sp.]MCO6522432.1 AMP-binding protein [Snodgrassella sp.]MCO6525104.1 AMP-binding protein [Snodgrassella sp.]PIT54411.1 long-chain-fatty-acid--CoA ligase [Snodgrassella communis]
MEKIWLNSYQEGVRAEVDVRAYSSIIDVLHSSVKKFGPQPSFSNMGTTLTYTQTATYVNQFTSYLQNILKLQKGERVAIMMPNVLQYPITVFGVLQAGGVVVNVNPLYTPRELAHQLIDSGATAIIVLENFAHTVAEVLAQTAVKQVIVASMGEMLGWLKGSVVNFMLRKVKKMVKPFHLPQSITFAQALALGKKQRFTPVPLELEDLALLQYTGGTTGVSKGAMLTHGNIVANMQQASEWIKANLTPGEEVVVTPLPLYHIFSLTVNIMIFANTGSKNILITNPRDINALVKVLKKNRVTVMSGVNTLFNALIHNEEFKTIDFASWKLVLGGGMATQKVVAQEWKAITGVPIIDAYGLTEASPGVCANPLNNPEYTGTAGLPVSNTDIEIRDDNGKVLGIGEVGELWVQGPQVMKGYWNRPEETAKVLDSRGFVATGDMAEIDAKGYVRLVDRKKDMILVSGFNVYPNEVEEIVAAMPEVLEVACIGIPNEKSGEAIKLFVVKRDPNLTREQIIAYCRQNLTGYKVPKDIEFCPELPKSAVGKILRKDLRTSK